MFMCIKILREVARAAGVVGTTLQTHEYDGLSRMTLCIDNNDPNDPVDDGMVSHAFDSLGRQIEETQSIADGSPAKVVTSDWEEDDERVGLTYPNGRRLAYTFDNLDRYTRIGDTTNPGLSPVATYSYIGFSAHLGLISSNYDLLCAAGQEEA